MKRMIFSAILCMAMACGSHDAQAVTIDGTLGISVPGVGVNISIGDVLGIAGYGYAPVPVIPLAVAPPLPPRYRYAAPPPRHHHMAPPPPRHRHAPGFRHHR
ncbi:MAG: hypothetical protein IKS68_07485 [Mailhella sp.]|nr:hypothetical protein [Mailhella sp.]